MVLKILIIMLMSILRFLLLFKLVSLSLTQSQLKVSFCIGLSILKQGADGLLRVTSGQEPMKNSKSNKILLSASLTQ